MNGDSNAKKEWLARIGIATFTIAWKVLDRLSNRPLPAKDHYYIMKFFRLFFRSYFVWISYPNPLMPQTMLHLKVNLCENNQQWFFRLRNRYELKELCLVAQEMKEAEVFVDVGSNIGVYALTIAQAVPNKRVVAFEPLESNFDSLQANLTRNGITNCSTYQKAISNAGGTVRFYVNPIHDGGGSLIPPKVYKTGDVEINVDRYQQKHPEFQPWIEVETVHLNDVIHSKSVLKIDVEGTEIDVLQSGYEVLRMGLVDLAVLEVKQETVDEVLQLMDVLQFDSFLLPDCTPITTGIRLPWFVKNIVCIRKNTPAHTRFCHSVT